MNLQAFLALVSLATGQAFVTVPDFPAYFNSTAHALQVYGASYYNPLTGEPIMGTIIDTERLPFVTPKIDFRGLPCACMEDSCGCCAGLNIVGINFDRRYCANFTYDVAKLNVDMKVMINEDEVFTTSFSARNPPPVCVPLPYVPILDFCLRLYDLALPMGNSLETCIDFEARLTMSPLLVMHFNCVRVDKTGLAWTKPSSVGSGLELGPLFAGFASAVAPTTRAPDDLYDQVDFEPTESDGIALSGSTLSPEEEDKIGEHRHTRARKHYGPKGKLCRRHSW